MREIADMMIDGTMCAGCGMFLHDGEDGDGFPGYCESCAPDYDQPPTSNRVTPILTPRKPKKMARCPQCKKKVTEVGLAQHIADKHGVASELLEALEGVEAMIESFYTGQGTTAQGSRDNLALKNLALKTIRAAIAKAKGAS